MAGEQSPEITRQLTEINKKLSNVITKGDGTLREMIKEVFQQMKDLIELILLRESCLRKAKNMIH